MSVPAEDQHHPKRRLVPALLLPLLQVVQQLRLLFQFLFLRPLGSPCTELRFCFAVPTDERSGLVFLNVLRFPILLTAAVVVKLLEAVGDQVLDLSKMFLREVDFFLNSLLFLTNLLFLLLQLQEMLVIVLLAVLEMLKIFPVSLENVLHRVHSPLLFQFLVLSEELILKNVSPSRGDLPG